MRKEYYIFRNEESLKLVKQGKQTRLIDGIVLLNWKLYGRHRALQKIHHKEIHFDVAKVDPFQKYDNQYLRKQNEILEVDKEIEKSIEEKIERLKQGSIDVQGRRSFDSLIAMGKKRRESLLVELDVIAKNWDTAMRKWIRTGPPKKRGRKSKSAVVFKTAKELKEKNGEEMVEEILESDIDNLEDDLSEDITVICEQPESDSTAILEASSFQITVKKEEMNGMLCFTSNTSQFNCGLNVHTDKGSSACMGIAVYTCSDFLKDTADSCKLDLTEQVMCSYLRNMTKVCETWESRELGPSLFQEAVKELDIVNLSVDSEKWWVDGKADDLKSFMETVYEIPGKKALVVTIKPAHTFVILLDGDNNQLLFNSHSHFCDVDETLEQAKELGHGAVGVFCDAGTSLLSYVLSKEYTDKIHCDSKEGDIIVVVAKNC